MLSRMDGVVFGKGRFGYESIELATNSRKTDFDSDLLIDFENGSISDRVGNYLIEENNITETSDAVMGKTAGISRGSGGLRLSGKQGSLFGTSDMTGSFLIEFWLKPFIAENGEIIFYWGSSRIIMGYLIYQKIHASFANNHILWIFKNTFDGYTENDGVIQLQSYSTVIPNKWTHHELSWNAETGLLEYRIDGKIEAIKYVTSNSHERGGSIYPLYLGSAADVDICSDFSGCVDDIHISRKPLDEDNVYHGYDTYRKEGGHFVTEPILVSQSASLKKIDAVVTKPEQTEVMFYVRSGDNFYEWDDSNPEWIPVKNHEEIKNINGLYFQIAADLFSDGGGKHTPSVTELKISYEETPVPLPPFTVSAAAGDGCVTINWSSSVDGNAGGYYVFYGEAPGEYLGCEAIEGTSPVDVGNTTSFTFTGLKNGKIYYFSVVAYSKINYNILGEFSREVHARPLRR